MAQEVTQQEFPVQPINDWVYAKPVKQATEGKVALPDDAQIGPPKVKVVACGEGHVCEQTGTRIPMPVKPGDVCLVAIPEHSKLPPIRVRGEDFAQFRARHIIGVVTGDFGNTIVSA